MENKPKGEFNKDIELIKKAVTEKLIPKYKCPVCSVAGLDKIEVVSGYFTNNVQSSLHTLNFGGNSIPTLAIICKNCGGVHQFALGSLGLLPDKKN